MRKLFDMKNTIKKYISKIVICCITKRNRIILICPYGIGDSLFTAFCIDELKRQTNKEIWVVCRSVSEDVFSSYNNLNKVIANTKLAIYIYNYYFGIGEMRSDKHIVCHFKDDIEGDLNVQNYHSITECYYYEILGLKGNHSITYPHVAYSESTSKELAIQLGIDYNTIIVSPYCNSSTTMPLKDWECLAQNLKEKGYRIKTNVNGTEKEIIGTERLECTLNDAFATFRYALCFVGYRSGLCDWLACSDTSMIVINNSRWGNIWDVNSFSKKHVYVLEEDGQSEQTTSSKILELIEHI